MIDKEKEILEEKLRAKDLIIDNLVKINLSMDEDRRSLLEEACKNYSHSEKSENNG